MTRKRSARTLKYLLYEASVQSPEWHAHYLPQFHTWLTGTAPRFFREDFCGTAKISLEWVLQSTEHTSLGLDLDPEPLRVARDFFFRRIFLGMRPENPPPQTGCPEGHPRKSGHDRSL